MEIVAQCKEGVSNGKAGNANLLSRWEESPSSAKMSSEKAIESLCETLLSPPQILSFRSEKWSHGIVGIEQLAITFFALLHSSHNKPLWNSRNVPEKNCGSQHIESFPARKSNIPHLTFTACIPFESLFQHHSMPAV